MTNEQVTKQQVYRVCIQSIAKKLPLMAMVLSLTMKKKGGIEKAKQE